ncbi:MAG TPA: D-TA family PLP-dependent enzyme [Pedobacter sp.]|nr:D-TA family PLP-dependent enzyme [Pedobacter sp.]
MDGNWYRINNLREFDTPLMAVYPDRIVNNIELALAMLNGNAARLRPHIKTHKTAEILRLFLNKGISKIKCATIAEAELAAQNGITDVLLAYQPVGLKINRFIALVSKYPEVHFSCITDSLVAAQHIAEQALIASIVISVYIDLNTGMNRTGYPFKEDLPAFYRQISVLAGLNLLGLHIYDGHLHDDDLQLRFAPAAMALAKVLADANKIVLAGLTQPVIIAGGSNTFLFYAERNEVECSPGTFVFWDMSYSIKLPELKFKPAAVLVTTVISKPAAGILCLDLGYKSVSAENPVGQRVLFVWNPDLQVVAHSEEHLTVKHTGSKNYEIGERIYGLPHHVCPTVALFDELSTIENNEISGKWLVQARRRVICL